MTQILTTFDFAGVGKIQNLPDGVNAQDPATVAQLRASIEGLAQKDDVRVRTASNISLSTPGATLDGVTMVANDRVLVSGQTTASENGIYIWNGASTAMTRALDANSGSELLSALVPVNEGTSAGTVWRQTAVNITLGTTAIAFVVFGTVSPPASEATSGIAEIATQEETDAGTDDARIVTPLKLANFANRKLKYSATFGDGSATQYTITHNLGTRDVAVAVYRLSGSYDQVMVDVGITTVNAVTVTFASAPALNAFRVVVLG